MSTTEIYGINKNGDVRFYDEVQNSWLGAPHVWSNLSEKYDIAGSMWQGYDQLWKKFSPNIEKPDYLDPDENIVLGSTFDHVIVMKKNIGRLITAFEKYSSTYPNSNFDKQIEIINEIEENEDLIGLAWCQTSVVDDLWDFEYDEEKDESIPYNLFKGDKHWNLFEGGEE